MKSVLKVFFGVSAFLAGVFTAILALMWLGASFVTWVWQEPPPAELWRGFIAVSVAVGLIIALVTATDES